MIAARPRGGQAARALPRPSIILIAALLLIVAGLARLGTNQREIDPVDLPVAGGGQRTSTDPAIEKTVARIESGRVDATAFSTLGALYLQKARESGDPGHYARADEALHRALVLAPSDPEPAIGLGALALARHQFATALEWGERARALAPGSAAAFGVVGDANLELGRYDDAFAAFQAMIDRRPDLSSYTRASYARELTGDRAGAVELMARAAQSGPPTGENSAWTLVQLGNVYLDGGELASAQGAYRRALAGYPGHPAALAGIARVRAARGDLAGAAALDERIVAAMPLAEHATALGELYQAMGRPADAERQWNLVRAIDALSRAAGVDTDVETVLFAADRGDDPVGTVARARTARERRPNVKADEALAWALRGAGDCAAALPYARASLRLGTREPLLLYRAGAVAACAGEPAEAARLLEDALALNPNFSPVHAPAARRLLQEIAR